MTPLCLYNVRVNNMYHVPHVCHIRITSTVHVPRTTYHVPDTCTVLLYTYPVPVCTHAHRLRLRVRKGTVPHTCHSVFTCMYVHVHVQYRYDTHIYFCPNTLDEKSWCCLRCSSILRDLSPARTQPVFN